MSPHAVYTPTPAKLPRAVTALHVLTSLAPSGQLFSIHGTQKDGERLVGLAVAVGVHLKLPLVTPDLEHIAVDGKRARRDRHVDTQT